MAKATHKMKHLIEDLAKISERVHFYHGGKNGSLHYGIALMQ